MRPNDIRKIIKIVALVAGLLLSTTSYSKEQLKTYSFQWQAFAPNAGGQQALSLRRADAGSEWNVFANTYLLANNRPLLGLGYDFRYAVCEKNCFLQAYAQLGGGISTGGPYVNLAWSSVILWLLRIDVATQLYFTSQRMIGWSYPLWFGISVPLPW